MGPPAAERLSTLPQLRHLNLACCPVTAGCTKALATAPLLQTLSLSGCDIEDTEVQLLAGRDAHHHHHHHPPPAQRLLNAFPVADAVTCLWL